MNTTVYQLNPLHGVVGQNMLLMDSEADEQYRQTLHLKAQVQSGDYFATIATQLDSICADVQQNEAAVAQLQRIIRDLLQLQAQYKIVKL
jgi:hypothetical protein